MGRNRSLQKIDLPHIQVAFVNLFLAASCARGDYKEQSTKQNPSLPVIELNLETMSEDIDTASGADAIQTQSSAALDTSLQLTILPPETAHTKGSCQHKLPRTGLTTSGVLVYLNEMYKPGISGDPTALDGAIWKDGEGSAPIGTAPSILDWNLCDKIAFHERANSVTRTIRFATPARDGSFELTIHRFRRDNENDGIGIWYYWDRRVVWKKSPLSYFAALRDYHVSCHYSSSSNQFICDHSSSNMTALDCDARRVNRPSLICTPFQLAR